MPVNGTFSKVPVPVLVPVNSTVPVPVTGTSRKVPVNLRKLSVVPVTGTFPKVPLPVELNRHSRCRLPAPVIIGTFGPIISTFLYRKDIYYSTKKTSDQGVDYC